MIKRREKGFFLEALERYLNAREEIEREWSPSVVERLEYASGEIAMFCQIFEIDSDFFIDGEYWELRSWLAGAWEMSDDEFNLKIGDCAA